MNNNWRKLISQPQYGIIENRDIFVPVRDGVRLAINVFRPDATGKFPALLAMSAYGKDEQDLPLSPQPLSKSAVWDGNIEAGDKTEIVPRGYVHIIGDCRGSGQSEGEYPGSEAKDCYDLIEWIAQQPWCDGNVGMIGYSYFSAAQLRTAMEQPPHLKAIFTSHIAADAYRDGAYNGGILSLMSYGIWDGRHGTSGFSADTCVSQMIKTLPKDELERRRQELLNHPDIKHYPNLYHLLHYPRKNPRFFDILLNPYDGPYWHQRSIYPFYHRIKVPIFIVGKCSHENMSYFEIFNAIKAPKKLLVKPNGPEERPWREDIETIIRWYDHWLKGNDTGIMEEPPIKLFVMGSDQWRYEKKWPLPKIEWTKCYLRRWDGLNFEPELYQNEPDGFFQQPLHVSTRRDLVKYVSPALDEELEVIGPAALHFFASIDQDDTNWIARLYDVDPTGSEVRVAKGYLKASHRAIDPAKSKPFAPFHPHTKESVELIQPGEIYEYNVGLTAITNVFKVGHRLKLTIESLESPRDPELSVHYHAHLNPGRATLHKIYRDKTHQSHLMLPVILEKKAPVDPGKRELPHTLCDDNCLLADDIIRDTAVKRGE